MAIQNRARRAMPIAILRPVLLRDQVLFIPCAGDTLQATQKPRRPYRPSRHKEDPVSSFSSRS